MKALEPANTLRASGRTFARRRVPDQIAIPGLTLVLVLILFELLVRGFHAGRGLIPAPSDVVPALVHDVFPQYVQNIPTTLGTAAIGYALGNGLAITLALSIFSVPPLRALIYEIGLLLYALPFIAIMPVLEVVLGTGAEPRIIVVTLACFFPTLTSSIKGLLATPRPTRVLFTLYGASGIEQLRYMIVPYALPYIFVGLKLTVGFAFLTALISEWIGANSGIGNLLLYDMFADRTAQVWAVALLASATTGLLFGIMTIIERLVLPWSKHVSGL
jgi:NitT/TauT family transport system permease protein